MSSVIDIEAWKAAHAPQRPARYTDGPLVYFCTRCSSELFQLLESGAVRCGGCSAQMRDLRHRSC